MDPVEGLVPEQENFFNAGELSYIEGAFVGLLCSILYRWGMERCWTAVFLRRLNTDINKTNTDSLGYHKVGNPGAVGAVTLHLYCPPPKLAKIWIPNKGTRPEDFMTVPTTLFSAFGKKLSENGQAQQQHPQQQPAGQVGSIMAPVVVPRPAPGAGEVVGSPPKLGADGLDKMAA